MLIRQGGRLRYVVYHGIPRWGLSYATLMLLVHYFSWPFDERWHGFPRELFGFVFDALFFGTMWSLWIWHANEKQSLYIRGSGTPSDRYDPTSMSYDLILKTDPNRDVNATDFEAMQQEVRANATLQQYCEVTTGDFAASDFDVEVLAESLESGEFEEQDFADFCARRGLPADPRNKDVAAAFLRSQWGLIVATFKLPAIEADARTVYAELVQFALQHGLRVTDPQKGQDVDLQQPGLLPGG